MTPAPDGSRTVASRSSSPIRRDNSSAACERRCVRNRPPALAAGPWRAP
jgi:hypothetical protein